MSTPEQIISDAVLRAAESGLHRFLVRHDDIAREIVRALDDDGYEIRRKGEVERLIADIQNIPSHVRIHWNTNNWAAPQPGTATPSVTTAATRAESYPSRDWNTA